MIEMMIIAARGLRRGFGNESRYHIRSPRRNECATMGREGGLASSY